MATTLKEDLSQRILIVEDDVRLAALLREYLSNHGFTVSVERRGDRAVDRILADAPLLVILDLMLPGLTGFEVCRRVRRSYANGILMLTASKGEIDQAVGLELGADDYVIKPVDPRILLARMRSVLRRLGRATANAPDPAELVVSGITISHERREVSVAGRRVETTLIEFDVLWRLALRAGEVVSRDELYLQVQGIPYDGLDRGIDVHVSRIRRKLEACGFDASLLKGVRNMGYLLVKR
jgi:two-component system response regulator RstA